MYLYFIEGAKNSFVLASFLDSENSLSKIFSDQGYEYSRFLKKPDLLENELSQIAIRLCHFDSYKTVDGCLFIFPHTTLDFEWKFFNSDGSSASMCGNAARAVSFWYNQYVQPLNEIKFKTSDQIVHAQVLSKNSTEAQVEVSLKKVKFVAKYESYQIYDSGVPHLCVDLTGKSSISLKVIQENYSQEAQSLRFPSVLNEKGSNVTYIYKSKHEADLIHAVTFERGVENWTQACGTGALAAAKYAIDYLNLQFPVKVQMPGGLLVVDETETSTLLLGPAQINKVIKINLKEFFLE